MTAILIVVALIAGAIATTYVTGNLLASGTTIEACANGQHMRIVDSSDDCKKNEEGVSWNQQGIQGDPGAKGDTGDTGAKGDTGDTGAKGDTGDTGDTGAPGADGGSASFVYGPTGLSASFGGTQGSAFTLDCGTAITNTPAFATGIYGDLGVCPTIVKGASLQGI